MGDVLLECFLLPAFRHCSGEIPHRADRSRCGQSPFHQEPSFCLAAFNTGGSIIISPQKVIFFKLISSLRPGRRIFCNHIIAPNKQIISCNLASVNIQEKACHTGNSLSRHKKKTPKIRRFQVFFLELLGGFEPPTSSLPRMRSTD